MNDMRGFALLTKVHGALWRVDTPAGYIASGRMHYYIRDHQGNVRQVTDSDGNVEQDNHYYPYGMLMGESSDILATARSGRNPLLPSRANPYLYGGKEYLTTAGANLLDFTARTYDPTILLFHTPDPLRDKYLPVHSYLYCGANPINRIDPTGKDWKDDKVKKYVKRLTGKMDKKVEHLEKDVKKCENKIANLSQKGKDTTKEYKKIENLKAQINELKQSKNEIEQLGADKDNTYAFRNVDANGSHRVVKGKDGVIYIEKSSDALALHELRHIAQSKSSGGFVYDEKGVMRQSGLKNTVIRNELSAYRIQYSFDKYDFPSRVDDIRQINNLWLYELKDSNGNRLYEYLHTE